MRLADLRGQVVLVNFWATSCAPCILGELDFAELEQRIEKLLAG